MQEADVWCNGNLISNHKGGYLPFTVDITNYIKKDKVNEILVKVDNRNNSSIPPGKELKDLDFNYYGGIYRNAYLITTNDLYITDAVHADIPNSGGVLIHFDEVSISSAKGFVKIHLQNDSDQEKKVKIAVVFNSNDGIKETFTSDKIVIKSNSSVSIVQPVIINTPKLWSPEIPNLYLAIPRFFS